MAATAPVATSAETLADTLATAYRNSGLLEQNRALLRAADEDVAVTVSRLRPILNWSADVTRTFGRTRGANGRVSVDSTDASIGLTAQLLLYDFGRTGLQIEAAKETVLATRETLRSIEQQVLLRAVVAFMNVRRNSEFVSLRQNNLRLLEQELRAAQDRFEVGEVTRTDVAQARRVWHLPKVVLHPRRGTLRAQSKNSSAPSAASRDRFVRRRQFRTSPVPQRRPRRSRCATTPTFSRCSMMWQRRSLPSSRRTPPAGPGRI